MRKLFEKLYKKSDKELYQLLEERLVNEQKTFVVTANPEVFMKINEKRELSQKVLNDDVIITPDGDGIVYATRQLGYSLWGKIAGVDTVQKMFEAGNKHQSKLYIYGSKQEVLDALRIQLNEKYPNLIISEMKNGYDHNAEEVFEDIASKSPDIVLVALGVPRQEELIASHYDEMKKGIFIGCGGSLDVLSGTKKRAPKIFIKLKLEWAYRLAKEPKRIKRFYDSNVKFMFIIKKMKKVK